MATPRVLVVYFSRTGQTRAVVEGLANALGADIDAIEEAESRKGFFGYWRSVGEARKRLAAPGAAARLDPSGYDLVIVGTPVWAWSMSSPVRAYLSANRARMKDVAFFATMGGSGARSAFAQMQAILGKAPVATLTVWQREVRPGFYAPRAQAFVKQMLAALEDRPIAEAPAKARTKAKAKAPPRKRAPAAAAKPKRAPRARAAAARQA
jgi:menaquinone-dependent protoporphyrinogen IX oxidase